MNFLKKESEYRDITIMETCLERNQDSDPPNVEIIVPNRNPAWWKRRTKLERKLCLVTLTSLVLLSVVIVTLAVFGYLYQKQADSRHTIFHTTNTGGMQSAISSAGNLCLTPGCIKAAASVMSLIDEEVDPCTDFFRFACGGWLKENPIPEDKSYHSTFMEVNDEMFLQLRAILETKIDESEPRYIKMAKDLYNTCMDLKKIEKAGSEPLKKDLKILGGWPVVEGSRWDASKFNWVQTLISLRKLGYNSYMLLDVSVRVDSKNNTAYIIDIDQSELGMPDREYLLKGLNDSATAAYYKLMVKSAQLLGADETAAEDELLKALYFETALANISWPREERRNVSKLYNKYTVKELQDMIPQIPWLSYLNGLLLDEIYENETLIVSVPDFVKSFTKLLTRTDKRVIANYMLWRVVSQSIAALSKAWRDIRQEYVLVLTGRKQEEPRWKQCIHTVRSGSSLGFALSSAYVRQYFKEESKDAAQVLVGYVQREFLSILENIDWMDEETKKEAKAKALSIRAHIAYPDELLNNTAMTEFYKDLTDVTTESHFENIRRLNKWSTDYSFNKLRKPNIKGDWEKHGNAAIVNAYYFWMENSIVFPAGILQMVFFDKERPNYMNFGSIGFVIGHEITHGFDDQGRQYDKDGNNVNWWDKATDDHYRKKAQCIIDQYSNYTAENGMNLNGINTQGENIADNGGVKEAYWAYHSWVKDNGPEQLLPGLKYNQNQLFWISAASAWCGKHRPEALKSSILAGYHSPGEFRVLGPMSNLVEFSKDYNCPQGSPMNKIPKCQVW